jgi:hypothetical protein
MEITYCSQIGCVYKACARHQCNAPANATLSIADMYGSSLFCTLDTKDDSVEYESLLSAICRGVQKSSSCSEAAKEMCDNNGSCALCFTIAEELDEAIY